METIGALLARAKLNLDNNTGAYLRQYGSYLSLVLLFIIASIISPKFLTTQNLLMLMRTSATLGIIAVGQTFVILTGGIDLSVSSMLSLSVVLVAKLYQYNDSNLLPLLILVIAIGAIVGLINGVVVAYLRVPPTIMTLGMLTVLQGIGLLITKGVASNTMTQTFRFIGTGYLSGIPVPIFIWLAIVIISVILLYFSTFGRSVYAVGGNSDASHLSGLNVEKTKVFTYIICSVTAAISGYILAAIVGQGDNWIGGTVNLDSIAAVVIGGTSFLGGRGGVLKTMAGVLLLGILFNVLILQGVIYYWRDVIKGLVILIGVIFYTRNKSV